MSVKKSWDVERKPAQSATRTQVSAPAARSSRVTPASRTKARKEVRPVVATRTRSHSTASKEPLKIRRARARKYFYIGLGIIGVLSLAAILYAAWTPALRITSVRAEGPNAEEVTHVAERELAGTHFFVVPRNSLFFIPESDIRKHVLLEFPNIVAVSFKAAGLHGVTVVAAERSPAFLWCGASHDTLQETCFAADADGLVFAPYAGVEPVASSTLLLKVYVPLADGVTEPIRAHVGYSSALPHSLRLAKTLRSLGANIAALALREDEADFYTSAGTRITYVMGREKEAAQLAASVFPKLLLNDGSVEYVDLRFESKVYLRKQRVAE